MALFSSYRVARLLTSLVFLLTTSVYAENINRKIYVDISSQKLADALSILVKQEDLEMLCNADLLLEKISPAIKGNFSVKGVISQILLGSKLESEFIGPNTFIIRSKDTHTVQHSPSLADPEYEADKPPLPEIIVVGETSRWSCCIHAPSTSTKTYVPTIEVPQSIEGIDSKLFRDRGNVRITETFRDYSSVNIINKSGRANIRGFTISENSILKDGQATVDQGILPQLLQTVDGIEIAKGANSTLYGYGEPGGIINLISKKPLNESFTNVGISYGSSSSFLSIDNNIPLNNDNTLLLRTNLFLIDERKADEFSEDSRQIEFAPSLKFEFKNDSSLTISAEYKKQRAIGGQGEKLFQPTGDSITPVSAQVFLNRPRYAQSLLALYFDREPLSHPTPELKSLEKNAEIIELSWLYKSKPYETWNYSLAGYIGKSKKEMPLLSSMYLSTAPAFFPSGREITLGNMQFLDGGDDFLSDFSANSKRSSIEFNTTYTFSFIGSEHDLLFGTNIAHHKDISKTQMLAQDYLEILGITPEEISTFDFDYLNIYSEILLQIANGIGGKKDSLQVSAGQYDSEKMRSASQETIFTFSEKEISTRSFGFYTSDHIHLSDEWKLLLAVGIYQYHRDYQLLPNSINKEFSINGDLGTITSNPKSTAFLPRVGITYLPTDDLALYSSYAEQFNVNNASDSNGSSRKPENTKAIELGLKWWPNKDLNLSISLFQQTKNNWEIGDDNLSIISQEGRLRSTGGEFNAGGFITPHWKLAANYSRHSLKSLESVEYADGALRRAHEAVPDDNAGLWLQYQWQAYGRYGWTLGIGANYQGSRYIELLDDNYKMDAYTLFDASISYIHKKFKVSLHAENLSDQEWYLGLSNPPIISNTGYYMAQGHGVRGNLVVQFYFQ